jgi:hypothetical protein
MADFSDLRRQLQRKATIAAQATASDWESRLRRTSPVDSGEMRAKTTVKARPTASGATIEAKVDTTYAHIVSKGQRPHVITPRNPGGVLVFRQGGQIRFARSVNHPGAQPRTWWDDALRDVPDMLQRNWNGIR